MTPNVNYPAAGLNGQVTGGIATRPRRGEEEENVSPLKIKPRRDRRFTSDPARFSGSARSGSPLAGWLAGWLDAPSRIDAGRQVGRQAAPRCRATRRLDCR